jgi:alkaline phosphatase
MPLIGLFSLDHMAYEIDRSAFKEPSLAEMTEKALQLLTEYTASSERGFLLLVEGSRIGNILSSKSDILYFRRYGGP